MKIINIFLASSITDMEKERNQIGNYIRTLNDRFMDCGFYIKLHMCEDMSASVARGRKQDEYNEKIRGCDHFYVMFHHSAGEYTIEEFNTAIKQFKATGAPLIMTFFKNVGEAIGEDVAEFMDLLDNEYQHYYTVFSHIDSVKLKILLELAQDPALALKVEFSDARVKVNGNDFDEINLENLPIYFNHEVITKLRGEIEQLEAEFMSAKLAHFESPDNDELWERFMEASRRKNEAIEALHKSEVQLYELSSHLVKLSTGGKYINERTKRAIALFDEGRFREVIELLDEDEYQSDKRRALEVMSEAKKRLEALVEERLLKIKAIEALGITTESATQIETIYEDIREVVFENKLDCACLIGYIRFLLEQTYYKKGEAFGEELRRELIHRGECTTKTWADVCNDLGYLFDKYKNFKKAEELFLESLKVRRSLQEEKNSDQPDADVALSCNNLGCLYLSFKQFSDAEKYLDESLCIYRRLTEIGAGTYDSEVARSCINLGALYIEMKLASKAETLYTEALEIYRRLAKKEPEKHAGNVAWSCNNLGYLYLNTNRRDKAEPLFFESLEIHRRLAQANPDANDSLVALTCNNIGSLLVNTDRANEAEAYYLEAVEIRRRLAKTDPVAYENEVAKLCNNLGSLYIIKKRYRDAEAYILESLEILRRLAAENPEKYEQEIPYSCIGLVMIYTQTHRAKAAKALLAEALELAKKYADTNADCAMIIKKYGR